jgi:rhamnose transport system substrate-binding protein
MRSRAAPKGMHLSGPRAHKAALASALAAEIAIFALVAPNFFTFANFFEIARLNAELGLLAVALTPILISGGIDLSVGAVMGLAAVCFGAAWRDLQLPIPAAAAVALAVGCAGGALNGLLISRLRLPALIVTLGTFSLFRGVAEGITEAAVNYSGFPPAFLALGQGYLWGVLPAQLPVFLLVLLGYFVLLHRSVIGRALYAIGFSTGGARYAGIPVENRVGLVYLLSGIVSGLAAVIYVAHLGQARSDAGNGYELDAITAVVLGGTSVFGGRGTLGGTVLGLAALSVLKNGLQLAALPTELTGILTGVLLVSTIAADRLSHWSHGVRRAQLKLSPTSQSEIGRAQLDGRAQLNGRAQLQLSNTADLAGGSLDGAFHVKNSQVAVLCAAILLGSFIVAGTNVWLVRSLDSPVAAPARRTVIAMMPKAKGDPYFVSCRVGAEAAAKELGVDLIWDGPTGLDAARQNELIESWITRGVDAIAVAVENRASISTALRKAQDRGIRVLTWDADAEPDARSFFVNQATAEGIGHGLTDEAARLLGGKGEFAIITGALSAANQNEWISYIKARVADRYPGLKLATIRPSDDDRDKAFAETQTILRAFPNVQLVMAISAPAVPGAGEAVRQARRPDVKVIGLSLPNMNKPYVHEGVVQTVMLWNTADLGYLAVYAGTLMAQNKLAPGATSIEAGRLGTIAIRGSEVILGPPLLFTKENIDKFDF